MRSLLRMRRGAAPASAVVAGCVAALAFVVAADSPRDLGRISFPTSGRGEAQERFLRGVLYLHSFEYGDAAREFQAAQRLAPGFAMAYWGEAMTCNHPIWMERDAEGARKILARLAPTPGERLAKAPSAREKGYLEAIETLFAPGEKLERDRAYADAMRRLHERFPDDDEAAAFYSLALLGSCQRERDVPTYMRAAAVAEEVFARNPEHPGAVHYLIHSYDDPTHAPLGLRPARVYARIAAAAPHALHMPSHIFLALGMWDDVVASNEASWEASKHGSYHALHWLEYGYLQQRRFEDARRTLAVIESDAKKSPGSRTRAALAEMRATWWVETAGHAPSAGAPAAPGDDPETTPAERFAFGLAALSRRERPAAERARRELSGGEADAGSAAPHGGGMHSGGPVQTGTAAILAAELDAALAAAAGETDGAVELLRGAAAKDDAASFEFGPPPVVKPPHELLGEVLLRAGRAAEARREFELALARAPGRALSLLGLARACEKSGDSAAAQAAYGQLSKMWSRADADLPEVQEARRK